MSLLGILRGLDSAGVRFVVIGGMAGQLHGSSRLTNDVDICYDTAPDNLAALATLLQRWRAYPRDTESGLPFVLDGRTLHNADSLTLTTTEGNLDVFAQVPGVGGHIHPRNGAKGCKAALTPLQVSAAFDNDLQSRANGRKGPARIRKPLLYPPELRGQNLLLQ